MHLQRILKAPYSPPMLYFDSLRLSLRLPSTSLRASRSVNECGGQGIYNIVQNQHLTKVLYRSIIFSNREIYLINNVFPTSYLISICTRVIISLLLFQPYQFRSQRADCQNIFYSLISARLVQILISEGRPDFPVC